MVWSLSGVLLAAFTLFPVVCTYVRHKRNKQIHFDQEEFITARRQVGIGSCWLVGWMVRCDGVGAVLWLGG